MTEEELTLAIAAHQERGEPLPPEIAAHPQAEAIAADLRSLTETLGVHNAEVEPPGDWEAKVWAGIAREEAEAAPRRPRWLVWLLGPALAGLVAAVALLWPGARAPQGLTVEIAQGGQGLRADHAKIGDQMKMKVGLGDTSKGALRVYRGEDELVLSCTAPLEGEALGCTLRDGVLLGELTFSATGRYRALIIYGEAPPPAGGLDADAAAARAAGLKLELSDEFEVL